MELSRRSRKPSPFSRRGNSVKEEFFDEEKYWEGVESSSSEWVQHVAETIINWVMMETDWVVIF